jgi:type I restriction enzyme S subunit
MEETIERIQHATYDSYKDSGFEWISEVPGHWELRKNKYLFDEINVRSKTGSEDLLSVSQYTGVTKRAGNIEEGELITNAESLEGYKKVTEGDLVSNIMLAWKGSLGFSDYDGIVSPAYSVYRLTNNFNPTFFHYLFRTELYKSEFKRNSTGVIESRLRLYTDNFFSISSFFPPKQEQDRIVSFLDQKTAQIDKAIAQKERLIELLNERRQIVIHKAVTRGLNPDVPTKDSGVEWIGDIPEHWEVKKLKFNGQLFAGLSGKKGDDFADEYVDGSKPFITFTNISNNEIIPDDEFGYVQISKYESQNKVEKNDLLFLMSSETLEDIGRSTIYLGRNREVYLNSFCKGFKINDENLDALFLNYLFQSPNYRNYFSLVARGFTRINLKQDYIKNALILKPPLSEQKAIVNYIDKNTAKIDESISLQHQEIEKLKEYKKSLINASVTGKIKV